MMARAKRVIGPPRGSENGPAILKTGESVLSRDEPYQPPAFETLLFSDAEAPSPEPVPTQPAIHLKNPLPPELNEPASSPSLNPVIKLWDPLKRPAA